MSVRNYISAKLRNEIILIAQPEIEEIDEYLHIKFEIPDLSSYTYASSFWVSITSNLARFSKYFPISKKSNSDVFKISLKDVSHLIEIILVGIDKYGDIIYESEKFTFEISFSDSIIQVIVDNFEENEDIPIEYEDLLWYYDLDTRSNIRLYLNQIYPKLVNIITDSSENVHYSKKDKQKLIGSILRMHYSTMKSIFPYKRCCDYIYNKKYFHNNEDASILLENFLNLEPNFLNISEKELASKNPLQFLSQMFPHFKSSKPEKRFFLNLANDILKPIQSELLDSLEKY